MNLFRVFNMNFRMVELSYLAGMCNVDLHILLILLLFAHIIHNKSAISYIEFRFITNDNNTLPRLSRHDRDS